MDTYLGAESFAGEEALWKDDKPLWAKNYAGRVTGDGFSGAEEIRVKDTKIYECLFHGGSIK